MQTKQINRENVAIELLAVLFIFQWKREKFLFAAAKSIFKYREVSAVALGITNLQTIFT